MVLGSYWTPHCVVFFIRSRCSALLTLLIILCFRCCTMVIKILTVELRTEVTELWLGVVGHAPPFAHLFPMVLTRAVWAPVVDDLVGSTGGISTAWECPGCGLITTRKFATHGYGSSGIFELDHTVVSYHYSRNRHRTEGKQLYFITW